MKAISPFCGGLIFGAVLGFLILAMAPSFATGIGAVGPIRISMCLLLVAVYAEVVLWLLGCFSPRSLERRPLTTCFLIGVGIPALGAWIFVIGKTICVVLSPPNWLEIFMGGAALAAMAILSPFLLVDWRAHAPPKEIDGARSRLVLKSTALAAILIILTLGIGRWAAEKRFERDCQDAATWVKTNYPVLNAYPGCLLPASQRLLTANHTVDAVVLSDGRVIVVLKTSIGWKQNWSGIIYSSGPIDASEIGMDYYGTPQIRIKGLTDSFIRKQIDSRHFQAFFDLG